MLCQMFAMGPSKVLHIVDILDTSQCSLLSFECSYPTMHTAMIAKGYTNNYKLLYILGFFE